MPHRLRRWLPALVAPVVVAGVVAAPAIASAAPPSLPAKSAQQVLDLVAKARTLQGFSGTVRQTSDLGLPDVSIPGQGGDAQGGDAQASSALDLLTGTHSARVWVAGGSRSHVAVLDAAAERDVIVNGRSIWTWDSKHRTAQHVTLSGAGSARPQAAPTMPADAAQSLLAEVRTTSSVRVDTAQRVAGRPAYTLVVTPRTTATTVGSVRIAVDAATGLPLDVQVIARGASSPAFETGFTSLSTAVPAASEFRFTPPKDATVHSKTIAAPSRPIHRALPSAERPSVTGTGWASIVEVPKADVPASLGSNALVSRLTTTTSAGRVLHTALVNVLLTTDGRVLAGAVPVSALTAAAG